MTRLSEGFIGIDLAWSPRHPTGVAALRLVGDRLNVTASGVRQTNEEIVDFVREHIAPTTIVMIDAPLIVPNETRMRPCDRLMTSHFWRQHAGAYPANRNILRSYNRGVPRGEELGLVLCSQLGFAWPPPDVRGIVGRKGRFVFECYPHPAQVILFGLDRTLKYKRKRKRQTLTEARTEFSRYVGYMQGLRSPRIELEGSLLRDLDVSEVRGRAYKEREDRLDAVFCAYLSALVTEGRMDCLGEPHEGSIVLPTTLEP